MAVTVARSKALAKGLFSSAHSTARSHGASRPWRAPDRLSRSSHRLVHVDRRGGGRIFWARLHDRAKRTRLYRTDRSIIVARPILTRWSRRAVGAIPSEALPRGGTDQHAPSGAAVRDPRSDDRTSQHLAAHDSSTRAQGRRAAQGRRVGPPFPKDSTDARAHRLLLESIRRESTGGLPSGSHAQDASRRGAPGGFTLTLRSWCPRARDRGGTTAGACTSRSRVSSRPSGRDLAAFHQRIFF